MTKLDKETLKVLLEKGVISQGDYDSLIAQEELPSSVIEGKGVLANWFMRFYDFLGRNYSELTQNGYTGDVKNFLDNIYGENWAELSSVRLPNRIDTEEWLRKLASEGYSYSTIRRQKNSVSKFFDFLRETQDLVLPDIRDVEIPSADAKSTSDNMVALRDEEIRGIIGHAETLRDKAMLLLLYEAGMRRNELLNVTKDDVDFEKLTVAIRNTKGGIDRIGYFTKPTAELLKNYLLDWAEELKDINEKRRERARLRGKDFTNELRKSNYLFQSIRGPQVSYSTLFRVLKEAAEKYYYSKAQQEGYSINEAKEIAAEKANLVNTEVFRNSRRAYLFSLGKSTEEVQLLMGDENSWVCGRFLKVAQVLYPEKFRV